MTDREIVLWAADAAAIPEHPNVVLWQGRASRPGVRSITACVEAQADEIRRRYLTWAHELGETMVGSRRLRERFVLADGASLWAQSSFVEQSPWIQRSVETLLGVLAFERLLDSEMPARVEFVGADADLAAVLRAVCRQRGVQYSWSRTRRPRSAATLARARRSFPRFMRGFVWLLHLAITRIGLSPARRSDAGAEERRVLICGPFSNHNGAECGPAGGEFRSRFWASLPRTLADNGFHVQWLHYFYAHEDVPDTAAARRIIERLNADSGLHGAHELVDSYLTLPGIARILRRWLAICVESVLVGWVLRRRFRRAPGESYWPLIRDDWAQAFRGTASVENLFYAECFDRALQVLPRHRHGLYLMENQGWERALARAWRKNGHGQLAAVAHSTVRYWDLRYHCDPRRYRAQYRFFLPGPDTVVLNGPAAREQYLSSAQEREQLADCEALRYLHLTPGVARPIAQSGERPTLRVLVLGDFQREATDELVRLADEARRAATAVTIEICVKPHPICPLGPRDYPGMGVAIVNDIVAELVPDVHAVLASNTTSSAVEAYVSGGRVFVYDASGVNYSPLRDIEGASFVHEASELAAALDALGTGRWQSRSSAQQFFSIDPALPRWRRYFDIPPAAADAEPLTADRPHYSRSR
jgi:surface carbohydrate biosynthesis protein (TIGR04326 family)